MGKFRQAADAGLAAARAVDRPPGDGPLLDDDAFSAANSERASDMMTDTQSMSDTYQSLQGMHAAADHDNAWHSDTQQEWSEEEAPIIFTDPFIGTDYDSDEVADDHPGFGHWKWQGQDNQGGTPDIAGSAHMISTLVDPLLFPLCYDRTVVLQNGGTVKLENVLASYGPARTALTDNPELFQQPVLRSLACHNYLEGSCSWSLRYQSLPCEVEFVDGGQTNFEVKITSYINGLHPSNTELYGAIEQVLSSCIQPWNDCLVRGRNGMHDRAHLGQLGPTPARIITYGVDWENELPEWATEFRVPEESRVRLYRKVLWLKVEMDIDFDKFEFLDVIGKEHLQLPSRTSDLWQLAREYLGKPELSDSSGTAHAEPAPIPDDWEIGDEGTWELLCDEARRVLCYKHPEPGTAFSYEEWKLGRHDDDDDDSINVSY
ncbi:hypothetical protein SEPCBS57363_006015 [Sporothrix epigloea]|uniref:DUF4246 domain-containing protein n=1 Tax=Sporothrix epigloea TaxID=1892477 RepID=A0ABP0E0S7_9PEZI